MNLENGSFGAYLVGYVAKGFDSQTTFQVVNPTPKALSVVVAFFDEQGQFVDRMKKQRLQPNGMLEFSVSASGRISKPPRPNICVVKIVSLNSTGKPALGIVGFQRHFFQAGPTPVVLLRYFESNLAAIPMELLTALDRAELKKILASSPR